MRRLRNKKELAQEIIISALGAGFGSCATGTSETLEGIDIDAEFQLIKKKKSQLSANMRKRVISAYNSQRRMR